MSPANHEDAELVRKSLTGDQRACRDLVRRYQRPVFSVLMRVVRRAEDAEDLAQETFVRMFRALDRAEELGPWVPGAQQAATFAGLAVWDRLNPGRRAGVVGAMERGAQKNQGKIFEIAKSFNRVDLFCGLRYSDPQERERCGPAGTTGKSTRANTVH